MMHCLIDIYYCILSAVTCQSAVRNTHLSIMIKWDNLASTPDVGMDIGLQNPCLRTRWITSVYPWHRASLVWPMPLTRGWGSARMLPCIVFRLPNLWLVGILKLQYHRPGLMTFNELDSSTGPKDSRNSCVITICHLLQWFQRQIV